LVPIKNGGFLNFHSDTINDQTKFLEYIKQNTDTPITEKRLKEMVFYLDTNPDRLDWNPCNRASMEMYTTKHPTEQDIQSANFVALAPTSEHYVRLKIFDYIGVKYFAYDTDLDDLNCTTTPPNPLEPQLHLDAYL
jgi:hypothetical protein